VSGWRPEIFCSEGEVIVLLPANFQGLEYFPLSMRENSANVENCYFDLASLTLPNDMKT